MYIKYRLNNVWLSGCRPVLCIVFLSVLLLESLTNQEDSVS